MQQTINVQGGDPNNVALAARVGAQEGLGEVLQTARGREYLRSLQEEE